MRHQIYIISLGPGDPAYLTPLARQRLEECEVIVGLKGLAFPLEFSKPIYLEEGLLALWQRLEALAGKKVGLVVSGDAGLFSLAQTVIKRLGPQAVKEVVPGISSLQVALARLKESWAGLQVFSFHGREIRDLTQILSAPKAAIFCDRRNSAFKVTKALLEAGLDLSRQRVYICQDLSLPQEKITKICTPEDLKGLSPARRELVILLPHVG